MKIRQVSYAAMAIAGGLGLATGPAFAQPAPPAAVGAPTLTPMPPVPAEPGTPPPAVEPLAPPVAEPVAPPAAAGPGAPPAMAEPLGAMDGGRMMMPAAGEGTGVRAEIMAVMMAQFHAMDANGDGRLTPEEFAAGWANAFLLLDQNADGFIDDADREIAARNLAATAAETRADRAATAGAGRGAEERRGQGNLEYRRGDGPGWGGHYEHHENGAGTFFFRFPGGMMHFYMMPHGEGAMGGNDRSGRGDMPGGMGGMPYFFHGFPGMQGMPWMQLMPGMPGGQGMPGGPDIQIQPMPGGDRSGGGAGGWVPPGEDRTGGGVGGWVDPGADRAGGGVGGWVGPDGTPAPAAPGAGTREAAPKP